MEKLEDYADQLDVRAEAFEMVYNKTMKQLLTDKV